MSGTSLDGIDVALIEVSERDQAPSWTLRLHLHVPYSEDVREAILSVSHPEDGRVVLLARLDAVLGDL